jgi:hypothetical protein
MPFGEVQRRADRLLKVHGGSFFLRPDGGDKGFTGTVITADDVALKTQGFNNWKFIQGEVQPHTLVMVSGPRYIEAEYRCFVSSERGCLAASQYRQDGKPHFSSKVPLEVVWYATEISKLYNPDPFWVIDVCSIGYNLYKVVEIGAFSVSGLYEAPMKDLVAAASEAALLEWKSYHDI